MSGNEFSKSLGIYPASLAKIRDELEIPYLKRGKIHYYLNNYEEVCANRSIIRKMEKARKIAISNNKGGVGKTTTTVTLGSILAFYGYKVLIVDMDTQSNTSRHFNIVDSENNIYTKLESGDTTVYNLESNYYNYGKLDLIPNDVSVEKKMEHFESNKLKKLLVKFEDDYDFILLDSPPYLVDINPQILEVSNFAFTVFRADTYSTDGFVNYLDLMNKYDCKLLGGLVLAMNHKASVEKANLEMIENIFTEIGSKICDTQVSYSVIFNEVASLREHSILTHMPKHKCTNEYLLVADFMIKNIIKGR